MTVIGVVLRLLYPPAARDHEEAMQRALATNRAAIATASALIDDATREPLDRLLDDL